MYIIIKQKHDILIAPLRRHTGLFCQICIDIHVLTYPLQCKCMTREK